MNFEIGIISYYSLLVVVFISFCPIHISYYLVLVIVNYPTLFAIMTKSYYAACLARDAWNDSIPC